MLHRLTSLTDWYHDSARNSYIRLVFNINDVRYIWTCGKNFAMNANERRLENPKETPPSLLSLRILYSQIHVFNVFSIQLYQTTPTENGIYSTLFVRLWIWFFINFILFSGLPKFQWARKTDNSFHHLLNEATGKYCESRFCQWFYYVILYAGLREAFKRFLVNFVTSNSPFRRCVGEWWQVCFIYKRVPDMMQPHRNKCRDFQKKWQKKCRRSFSNAFSPIIRDRKEKKGIVQWIQLTSFIIRAKKRDV